MPQAVAVPLAAAGIGAGASIFNSHKNRQAAGKVSQDPNTLAAQSGITDLARMLQGQASGIYNVGLPAYQRATGFYNSLLGSRTAQTAALAPALENTAASYAGAQNALGTRMQRGPAQDMARADLTREAAGAARNLYRDAPYRAAEALGGLGLQGLGQSNAAAGGAMQGYGGLLNNAMQQQQFNLQQRMYNNQQNSAFGSSLGSFFTSLLPLLMGGKGKNPTGQTYGGFPNGTGAGG